MDARHKGGCVIEKTASGFLSHADVWTLCFMIANVADGMTAGIEAILSVIVEE